MDALPINEQPLTMIPDLTTNPLWRMEAYAVPGSSAAAAVWAGRRIILSTGQTDWCNGSSDPKFTQAQIFACTTWS